MDPVSIVLIALVGLALVWLVYKVISNSRHAPPTKLRGGDMSDYGIGQDIGGSMARGWEPKSPRSGQGDDQTK